MRWGSAVALAWVLSACALSDRPPAEPVDAGEDHADAVEPEPTASGRDAASAAPVPESDPAPETLDPRHAPSVGTGSDRTGVRPHTVEPPAAESDGPDGAEGDEPRSFTVAATGDLLIHSPVWHSARAAAGADAEFDFRPMFDDVAGVFEAADLALCHLEVPLSRDNTDLSGYPLFQAPWQLAGAVADAGYDACSTASNHALDQGAEGVRSTLDALDEVGVGHAGTARAPERADAPKLYEAGGVTVGHVAATYGLSGPPPPAEWMVDLLDADAIAADAERARAAGAEFVVASLHWGVEYRREPTAGQRQLADELLGGDAIDLVVGHHAHRVQPVERRDDGVVVFGLGNFLSHQSAACCPAATQDGLIALVDVGEVAPGEFEATDVRAVPTWVDRDDGHRIVDVLGELAAQPDAARRRVLQASRRRTHQALVAVDGETAPRLVSARQAAKGE